MLSVVDAGALYAAIDMDDKDNQACVAVFSREDIQFVIPVLAIAEVSYLVETRLGASADARFLRALADFEIETPEPDDWLAIADLVERYSDFPLGAVDASVAVLADRLGTDLVVTLDRRHFSALRTPAGNPYRLLPD